MRKKFSIDKIGMRGCIALLILGAFLLVFGTILQIQATKLPDDAVECVATITGFTEPEDPDVPQITSTLVSYKAEGKQYTDVPLGQYESSWKIGDTIKICCNSQEPTHIWTRTMQYRGIFYILFSASPLLISIYKILQFRKIKGINDDESDIDTTGEEKFKISSAIIPLIAGIPLIICGIIYFILEHSIIGIVVVLLGAMNILTSVFSFIDYVNFKRSFSEKNKNINKAKPEKTEQQ